MPLFKHITGADSLTVVPKTPNTAAEPSPGFESKSESKSSGAESESESSGYESKSESESSK